MRNRLMRFVVCALAWLSALVLLVPVSLAEEDGGTLDNIEWRFADGVMTLKGDGILTGPNRPWDAYKLQRLLQRLEGPERGPLYGSAPRFHGHGVHRLPAGRDRV